MLIRDMAEYEQMRDSGKSPEEIYWAAKQKYGKDDSYIYLMRHLYNVGKSEARDLITKGETYGFQQHVLPKYLELRDSGATPHQVYLAARKQGLDWILGIRILRSAFDLDFLRAKEVIIQATGIANSLAEHEENVWNSFQSQVDEWLNSPEDFE